MEHNFIYRRKEITTRDIDFIRKVIRENPNAGRCFLSRHICRVWNWTQPNGYLKDGVCRGLLLHLEAEGYIKLPPRKSNPPNPFVNRKRPPKIQINQIPIQGRLSDIHPLHLKQIRRTPLEKLFNSLVEHYHLYSLCPRSTHCLHSVVICRVAYWLSGSLYWMEP
jgi:hypothetical protein